MLELSLFPNQGLNVKSTNYDQYYAKRLQLKTYNDFIIGKCLHVL